jgi:hypothetical protein
LFGISHYFAVESSIIEQTSVKGDQNMGKFLSILYTYSVTSIFCSAQTYRVYINDLATVATNWKKKDIDLLGNYPRSSIGR